MVVGASVSGADIAYDLASHDLTRDEGGLVHAIVVGRNFNIYFKDTAFHHPRIAQHPSIARIDPSTRTVHLIDGTSIPDVDHLIFGTGYSWSLPFLPSVSVRNNRVPGLYQHVIWQDDPTLVFVGAVGAGLTFKIFEWQAVYAARVLAGKGEVPSKEEMREWEEERVKKTGDGPKFQMVYPDFEEYFETLRRLAGEPSGAGEGGRRLPGYDQEWFASFMRGHDRRIAMWTRENEKARKEIEQQA